MLASITQLVLAFLLAILRTSSSFSSSSSSQAVVFLCMFLES